MRALVYALAVLLNGIVVVWWGLLDFAVTRQHGFAFDPGALSIFIVPVAAGFALVAMAMKLRQ
jgi:hypothetical protein